MIHKSVITYSSLDIRISISTHHYFIILSAPPALDRFSLFSLTPKIKPPPRRIPFPPFAPRGIPSRHLSSKMKDFLRSAGFEPATASIGNWRATTAPTPRHLQNCIISLHHPFAKSLWLVASSPPILHPRVGIPTPQGKIWRYSIRRHCRKHR